MASTWMPKPAEVPGWPHDPNVEAIEGLDKEAWFKGHQRAVDEHARWVRLVEAALAHLDVPRQQLASAIGASTSAVSDTLNGKSWPKADLVWRISAFLGIDISIDYDPVDRDTFPGAQVSEWGDWRHSQRDGVHVTGTGERVVQSARPRPNPHAGYGAHYAGYERGWNNGFEGGQRNPDPYLQERLAEVLGLADALLALHDPDGRRVEAQQVISALQSQVRDSMDHPDTLLDTAAEHAKQWVLRLDEQ